MKKFSVILSSLALAALFSGCGLTPKPSAPTALDTTLPIVKVDAHLQDMTSIAFEWKPIKDPRVVGINVYRSNPATPNNTINHYATLNNRFATHYVDAAAKPNTTYRYFFTTFSKKAISQASPTITITTPPVLSSIVWLQGIGQMPRSAKIIWRPATNPLVEGYIIERQTLEHPVWKQIEKLKGRLNSEYINTGLANNEVYKYRIRVYTYNDLVSTPSQSVKIVTKPLPNGVQNLVISNTLPRNITLTWSPSTIKDFSYYKIYRSSNPNDDFEYYAKTTATHFTDHVKQDAKRYYYKVTVVDTDGLESKQNIPAMQGTTLAPPTTPYMVAASIVNGVAYIQWADTDPRAKSFIILKKSKVSWLDNTIQKIKNITKDSYKDHNIYADVHYTYQVIAVDKNGIESLPSKPAEVSSSALPAYKKPAPTKAAVQHESGSTIQPAPDLGASSL